MTRALAAALLLLATAAFAQTASEQVTVHLIEVPVYVERGGASVAGLTRDDFELRVNGEPREIVSFDVITSDRPAPAAEAPQAAAPTPLSRRRLSVLLFDASNIALDKLPTARIAARKFVDNAPAGESFAVAILDRRGIALAVPFTTDRAAVRRAITTFSGSASGDPLLLGMTASERQTSGVSEGTMSAEERTPEGRPSTENPLLGQEKLRLQRDAIETLGKFADRLAPIDAIKQVIFISEGWDLGKFMLRPNEINALRPLTVRMHERFGAAGVTLSAVDAAGLRSPADGTVKISDELYALALDTGGTVTTTLAQLRETQRVVYVLGFRAPASRRAPEISVRLKNQPGARVLHPRGFAPDNAIAPDDALFLADVLLNDIPQEGLTVHLSSRASVEGSGRAASDARPTRPDASTSLGMTEGPLGMTEVTALIPGRELLALADGNKPLLLDVLFYVFDARNSVAAWKQRRLSVNVQKGREFLQANPFLATQAFELAKGRYVAKALVRVVGKPVLGFRRAEFTVP